MRLLTLLKGKIHRATVTSSDVDYIGSITIDSDLMERSGIVEGELVHVWNVTNGQRFITYAIPGERLSGIIQINGSAAHRAARCRPPHAERRAAAPAAFAYLPER